MVASWMSRSAPAACVAALLESSSSRVSDRMTSLREVPLVRVRVRVRARARVRLGLGLGLVERGSFDAEVLAEEP